MFKRGRELWRRESVIFRNALDISAHVYAEDLVVSLGIYKVPLKASPEIELY